MRAKSIIRKFAKYGLKFELVCEEEYLKVWQHKTKQRIVEFCEGEGLGRQDEDGNVYHISLLTINEYAPEIVRREYAFTIKEALQFAIDRSYAYRRKNKRMDVTRSLSLDAKLISYSVCIYEKNQKENNISITDKTAMAIIDDLFDGERNPITKEVLLDWLKENNSQIAEFWEKER